MRGVWAALGLAIAGWPALAHAGGGTVDLLVYTRTTEFRHDSIPAGIAAVEQIAADRGWTVVATEDPAMFEPTTLAVFDVIVFLSTTGDVLDPAQEAAFTGWVQAGGGFVGIHSATNTEEEWPWFVGLLGTTFADHPASQTATIHVQDATHPATTGVPDPWVRFDEWYNFDSNPSASVDVLLQLDETSYTGGTMGRDHPIAWAHAYDGGRSFYTALGHTIESWSEPEFLAHVAGGIAWAATAQEPGGDASTSDDGGSDDGLATSSDGSPAGSDAADTGDPTAASTGTPADPSMTTALLDDGSTTGPATDDAEADGCACRSRDGGTANAWWLALALLVRVRVREVDTREAGRVSAGATRQRTKDRQSGG